MALNVIHFKHNGRAQWGVVRNGLVTPVPGDFATTGEFIVANTVERLACLDNPTLREREVQLVAPVTRKQQFLCQGANYRQHMIESGMDPDAKKFNMIFTKSPDCIVAADSDVVMPRQVRFLDYEIELDLVLKRSVHGRKTITDSELHEYVAALVIVNDYSAPDVQIPQMQFYKGKSFRTFDPVGPHLCLLERNDFPRLRDLHLRLTVNDVRSTPGAAQSLIFL